MTTPSPVPERHVPVVIVGAGPAGLTVANILRAASVDCVVLESESREFIEQRPRAGFLEEWAVRALQRHGLADRILAWAPTHTECEFRFSGERRRFPYTELTGHHHIQREALSVRHRMGEVLRRLGDGGFHRFESLFDASEGRLGIVVTFLALLELAKEHLIEIVQEIALAPIYLKSMATAAD